MCDRNREALSDLKEAVKVAPANPDCRIALATTYLELGETASAKKEITEAKKLGAPKELIDPFLTLLGNAKMPQKPAEEAKSARPALPPVQEPSTPESENISAIDLNNAGVKELNKGNFDGALSYVRL